MGTHMSWRAVSTECGLMQSRNVPKGLTLVNFPEAALLSLSEAVACLTCVEKSKHCIWSKFPAKYTSDMPCFPTPSSWALSKHISDLLMLKSLSGPHSSYCPPGPCFWSPPYYFLSLYSFVSLEWFHCLDPLWDVVLCAQMLAITFPL